MSAAGRIAAAVLRTPGAAVTAGALLVGAAIAVNAIFLQTGRHPSPFFITRPPREATPNPDETVRAIQAALKERGFYAGAVDGLPGGQTSAAIAAFQDQTNTAAGLRAGPELLAAIRQAPGRTGGAAAPMPVPKPAPAVEPVPARDQPDIALVQRALNRAAYGPLTADGMMGRQTQEAISRFQSDHGLAASGAIDDALLMELRALGALDGA